MRHLAFIARLGLSRAPRVGAAGCPSRAGSARIPLAPATLALSGPEHPLVGRRDHRGWAIGRALRRVGAWTVAWTLFQWWAVIGWPEGLGAEGVTVLFAGAMGVVGIAVWRDLRIREVGSEGSHAGARVAPLPVAAPATVTARPSRTAPPRDLAA